MIITVTHFLFLFLGIRQGQSAGTATCRCASPGNRKWPCAMSAMGRRWDVNVGVGVGVFPYCEDNETVCAVLLCVFASIVLQPKKLSFLKGMMVRIWVVFLKTSRGALRCWWTAGVCRSSQMRIRRRATQSPMKSSTTTSLLELWVSHKYITQEEVFISQFWVWIISVLYCVDRMLLLPTGFTQWGRNIPRNSTAGTY